MNTSRAPAHQQLNTHRVAMEGDPMEVEETGGNSHHQSSRSLDDQMPREPPPVHPVKKERDTAEEQRTHNDDHRASKTCLETCLGRLELTGFSDSYGRFGLVVCKILLALHIVHGFWDLLPARHRHTSPTTHEDSNCKKQNHGVHAEHNKRVCVRPLGNEAVYLKGDVTIIDPFKKIFCTNRDSMLCKHELQQQLHNLQRVGHWEFLVTYRGEAAYFISSDSWDADAAFEISRKGRSLGVDEIPSRFIAVITQKMMDLLQEDKRESMKVQGGVSVQGVDGQLICSGDGDFVISTSGEPASPGRKLSRWIDDECVWNADILCATGGKWTFDDDSTDEEDEHEEYW